MSHSVTVWNALCIAAVSSPVDVSCWPTLVIILAPGSEFFSDSTFAARADPGRHWGEHTSGRHIVSLTVRPDGASVASGQILPANHTGNRIALPVHL
jgi:hypothetical protein